MRMLARLALFGVALLPLAAQGPLEIVQKSLDRDFRNFDRLKDYTFVVREEDRDYDSRGKLKKTESETNEVLILGGRPYERLIARNDKPLSARDQMKEQDKLDRELAKRQKESANEQSRWQKERAENRRFLQEIPAAYNLKLLGTEMVSGKPTWVIDAAPKAGYKAKQSRAEVLTKIHAKIWIDQAEYQWVKVDAEAVAALSFGLGIFRIAAGGKLHFEQTRVNDEVWLPAELSAHGDARIAYFKKLRGDVVVQYRDYRKFQTDSRIVATEQ